MTFAHLETEFDTANAYVAEIAQLLLASEQLEGDWGAAALCVILDGTNYDASGFVYHGDRRPIPIAPSGPALYDKLIAYRDWQSEQSGDPVWKACLIQADRASNSFEITVEYDDPMRWKITPGNLKELRAALRP